MADPRFGDPFAPDRDLGPLARRDLRDRMHQQVEGSIAKGARVLLGGTVPAGNGAFYPATVLTDVQEGCPAYDEEIFGPVGAVIPVESESQAIQVAKAA